MDYRILGETLPVVEIRLMTGEAMYTQSGGMAWMSEGLLFQIAELGLFH